MSLHCLWPDCRQLYCPAPCPHAQEIARDPPKPEPVAHKLHIPAPDWELEEADNG